MDAAGFLTLLGLFTAHMSGNTTGLGLALATGDWGEALRRAFVIPIFVVATVAGVAWIEGRSTQSSSIQLRERAVAGVLAAEVVMLVAFIGGALALGDARPLRPSIGFFLTAAAASVAMGLQNAALRRVHSTAVHTTFVTGVLTEMAVAVVRWWIAWREERANGGQPNDRTANARATAQLAASIWASYLAGAWAGAWLVSRFGIWTVVVPIMALVVILILLLRSSPELRAPQ